MNMLAQEKCRHHHRREAVARCPGCNHYFCRECITEHEDRVLCASCLNALTRDVQKKTIRLVFITRSLLFFMGLLTLWISFYYLGQFLLTLPASFHEGTLWQTHWWEGL